MTEPNETAQDDRAFAEWKAKHDAAFPPTECDPRCDSLGHEARCHWAGADHSDECLLECWNAAQASAKPIDDRACPCRYVDPCRPHCSCAEPVSSIGCARCCSYGNYEQRKAMAERLTAAKPIDVSKLRVVQSDKAWFLWRENDDCEWETIGAIDVLPLSGVDAAEVQRGE